MDRQQFRGIASLRIKALLNFLIVLLLLLGCENGLTQAGNQSEPTSSRMQIRGKISIKGSGPHTYLCLSKDSGIDYRLTGELKDMIWSRYQQEKMMLEGVLSKKALGPGAPAEFTVHKIMTPDPK